MLSDDLLHDSMILPPYDIERDRGGSFILIIIGMTMFIEKMNIFIYVECVWADMFWIQILHNEDDSELGTHSSSNIKI